MTRGKSLQLVKVRNCFFNASKNVFTFKFFILSLRSLFSKSKKMLRSYCLKSFFAPSTSSHKGLVSER